LHGVKILANMHTFLWFVTDAPQLGAKAKTLLEDPDTERLCSMASVSEIAIKTGLGKLTLRKPVEEFLPEQLEANRFTLLNIGTEHALRIARLPMHHRDPFRPDDRVRLRADQDGGGCLEDLLHARGREQGAARPTDRLRSIPATPQSLAACRVTIGT